MLLFAFLRTRLWRARGFEDAKQWPIHVASNRALDAQLIPAIVHTRVVLYYNKRLRCTTQHANYPTTTGIEIRDSAASGGKNIECSYEKEKKKEKNSLSRMKLQFDFSLFNPLHFGGSFIRARYDTFGILLEPISLLLFHVKLIFFLFVLKKIAYVKINDLCGNPKN